MTIQLPEELQAFVDEQIASGRCASRDEFIETVLRATQQALGEDRNVTPRVEAMILEAINEGHAQVMTAAHWDTLRRDISNRSVAPDENH